MACCELSLLLTPKNIFFFFSLKYKKVIYSNSVGNLAGETHELNSNPF